MNKTQQNSTDSNFGLTVKQQKAVELLIEGKSKTDISKELNIDRSTLYNWEQKLSFQHYLNYIKNSTIVAFSNRLFSISEKAIIEVENLLESQSESMRFKAASFILGISQDNKPAGNHDVRSTLKSMSVVSTIDWDTGMKFDQDKYLKLCDEYKIDPHSD